ncbi:GDSL esterase/lipase At5g45950-like [Lolium rigidum]|uniref:GDSL esterase/lipase At5g45950-like n=1 Tax=Lolium rigidum TaxID=89674 RepID=UPI001F5D1852|nr:GDSL esterase/lipase At5g45950-like [Lolium rigidum]
MRRLAAVLAVALLLIAWQPSLGKAVATQSTALPPPDEQDDDAPRYSQPSPPDEQEDNPSWPGLPLLPSPPPPEESDAPVAPLPGSQPPPPEPETPAPAAPPPPRPRRAHLPPRQDDPVEPETPEPPHQRPAPLPPKEPTPPRTVVPPQEPGWAAVPLPLPPTPAPGRALNYSATGWTTMLVFGDSTVDPGNNNRLQTVMRANFLPYGASFLGGRPTGRFSNGRLITDILAEKLGIGRTIPGFREPRLRPRQLRRGVSFASAGSGYDDATARISNTLSFSNQVEDLWRYKRNLQRLVGPRRAEQLVRRATFVISAGTTDVFSHYLATNRSRSDSWPSYENLLITRVANYTQVMRALGGRRFVFVGVPPVGCLPLVRTLLGTGAEKCHENMNSMAASFNRRLDEVVRFLKNQRDTRATFIDVYPIVSMATIDPVTYGLTDTSRGCCGTGVIEVGQTCRGRLTCPDPSKYMYWDAVHQTERMNQIITDQVIMNSIGEIYA